MYTREETSRKREEFWTTFGRYMTPVLSADGEKINWVNYKTGKPGVRFRMDADAKHAMIAIELSHADTDARETDYERFLGLRAVLCEALGEEWQWLPGAVNENGKQVSLIRKELDDVNIFRNEDWPEIISFFKTRIMALDEFWSMAKYGFDVF